MTTQEQRAVWKDAMAAVCSVEAERRVLVASTDARYAEAKERLAEIEDATGEPIASCEGCGDPIFDGDPILGGETPLCGACAPSFDDLLKSPGHFANAEGEPMSEAEAKAIYDAHISGGGEPSDSMAVAR